MPISSLKTRITLLLPVSICIVIAVILFAILRYFEDTVQKTIATQQNLSISILADEIDQKLLNTQKPLIALANKLTPQQIADPDEALAFLLERTEFVSLFDNGIFLFNNQGRMVAELPLGISRTGTDFSFREYLRVTLATRAPQISDPYISSQSHHRPAIMLTTPIFDSHGDVIAILGGSIVLTGTSFPGKLNTRKIGNTGYVFLIDTTRMMISHPDQERVMKKDTTAGENLLMDRAIHGFEGTDVTVNSRGIRTLTSFKRLHSKNWILGADYPTAEAFASVANLRNIFNAGIIPLLLVLFFLMRRFFGDISKPLLDFTQHIKQLQSKSGADRLYPESSVSEIATLGRTFNQLITELDSRQEAAQTELAERKRIEENLRKLSHVVEQSPVSIVITNLQGNIEYANPHFSSLTGYSLNELSGKNPRILKSGFTSKAEYTNLWKTILSGGQWHGEFQNIKKNGELYWEQAMISPLRDKSGRITHLIAIKTDITDRKSMETQLLHSQKMEAVGQLAGGIAHDFNNILTAIIGYATVMQNEMSADNPNRAMFDQLLGATTRGSNLIQGLLSFSRKQPRNPRNVDLNGIVEGIEKLLQRLVGENIRLAIKALEQPLHILADALQIEQVLMNLVTNARDALSGEGTITITTKLVTLDAGFVATHGYGTIGRFALLTVSDTGLGMSSETTKHIFEPFYTTKETGKGTGLGLSIAYGVIKTHAGYIICHSVPNEGTTFSIYLPLTEESVEIVSPKPTEAVNEITSEVILLINDNRDNRELIGKLLQEFGYEVVEAENGAVALETIRGCRDTVNLVILDIGVLDKTGMDLYQGIREINPDIRVLFSKGTDFEPLERKQLSDPNLYFISKPFMPKELLMKIREVFEDVP